MKCHAGDDHGPATFYRNAGWLCDACWCWMYLRGLLPLRAIAFVLALAGCDFVVSTTTVTLIDADVDARLDAEIDAPEIDAPCTPMMQELLVNPAFDQFGGWNEQSTLAIITTGGSVNEDTQPNKAWMGGVTNTNDSMFQDIWIPTSAYSLRLTGKYQVRTTDSSTSVHDVARIAFDGTGPPLFELDNTLATTVWETFSIPILAADPNTMRRLTFSSTNDGSQSTSFYFDSLSLIAGVCE